LKIKLSQPQVHRVMYRLKQQRAEQPALEFVPVAADEDSSAAVAGPSVPESAASASRPEANQLERALVGRQPSRSHLANPCPAAIWG
jgi:hypothetical protein